MRSLLAEIRSIAPRRPLTPSEARYIAERQAQRLLALRNITSPPLPSDFLESLPYVRVEYVDSKHSGISQWHRGHWYVLLSSRDSRRRVAFSAGHELKHIIDHGRAFLMYPATRRTSHKDRVERACNEFASALLMPKIWVRRAWTGGIQDVADLASLFGVSRSAMRVRLEVLGLVERTETERTAA